MKKVILTILGLILAAFGGSQVSNLGGTPGNLPSDLATSSTVSVGQKSVNVLFATSTPSRPCATRVITTKGDPILFLSPGVGEGDFGSSSLQNGFGHLQAASSTISYRSDEYGCGAWIVMGVGTGTTTISISEFRQ